MDDLISRQAAIDAIESAFDRETILNRFVRKVAIIAVRKLPSAQPELPKQFMSDDCISRSELYKILEVCEIRKATIGNPLTDWEYGYTCGIERAESEIECAPTVDAVPVIRCKDCKHWDGVDTCDVIDAPVWDNDFCSMAERR